MSTENLRRIIREKDKRIEELTSRVQSDSEESALEEYESLKTRYNNLFKTHEGNCEKIQELTERLEQAGKFGIPREELEKLKTENIQLKETVRRYGNVGEVREAYEKIVKQNVQLKEKINELETHEHGAEETNEIYQHNKKLRIDNKILKKKIAEIQVLISE